MVDGLPGQLREAYAAGSDVIEEAVGELGGVVVTGMGGSAIGGDLVAAAYSPSLPSPMVTVRGYGLPGWVSSRSLVFAVSYSGNTEESVSCLEEALERGCTVVTVCSGGRMAEISRERNLPTIRIPSGLQPRAAFGYLSIPIASCLESLGLVEAVEGDISETIDILEELRSHYGLDSPTAGNPAKQLAVELHGKIPVIYGCEFTSVAARRWKCQINENSKSMAFTNEFPELNHNEIVGWENPAADLAKFRIIYLNDDDNHPQNRKRMEITADVLRKYAGEVYEHRGRGGSRLARLFSSIYLGDYTSIYLAALYGTDPSPVQRIEDLKKRLA